MKASAIVGSIGLMALGGGLASAHHSYSSFDMAKTIKLEGVVKEWHWTNPHSFILLQVTDAAGHTSEAILETNGPGYLARQGWKRESLHEGDKISATLHPMRDGSAGGNLTGVTLASGQTLSAEIAPPKPVAAGVADENKNGK